MLECHFSLNESFQQYSLRVYCESFCCGPPSFCKFLRRLVTNVLYLLNRRDHPFQLGKHCVSTAGRPLWTFVAASVSWFRLSSHGSGQLLSFVLGREPWSCWWSWLLSGASCCPVKGALLAIILGFHRDIRFFLFKLRILSLNIGSLDPSWSFF